ncbi:hypothetical protein HGRIS_000246 [Hohenbuehelia grisea]|uniref:SWR1-complex protein 5 n=1 Tax=Hohenbuehelia grisea TaxID=104357 RepID=A0ABR3JQG4_9AGAR
MKPQAHDSDSEDDSDYAPPVAEGKIMVKLAPFCLSKNYPPDDASSSDDEPNLKRVRTTPPQENEEDDQARKAARDALWASFQASVSGSIAPTSEPAESQKLVKVEKRYRYAGEEVIQVVEVPADSSDAKKWPLWKSPADAKDESNATSTDLQPPSGVSGDAQADTLPSSSSASVDTATPKPAGKRPGPRRPRTTLASLPTSASKAKKLTTLEKSAMDWRSHVTAQDNAALQDELEANKRSGGYLDKVEFLQRVDERKDEAFEAAKSNKRRRG